MDAQKIRIFLIVGLFLVGFTLYGTWQQEHPQTPAVLTNQVESAVPTLPSSSSTTAASSEVPQLVSIAKPTKPITIETDLLKVNIDLNGGDIVRTELKKYPANKAQPDKGYLLFDQSESRQYVAQSYLIADDRNPAGPDAYSGERGIFKTAADNYVLSAHQKEMTVDLIWDNNPAISFIKRFHFYEDQYLINVEYLIENKTNEPWQGKVFYQLRRQISKDAQKSGFMGVQMYQGGAFYTPDKPFNKFSFDKMKSQPLNQDIQGGWVALLEHYFLSAWIPGENQTHHFYSKVDGQDIYKMGTSDDVRVPAHSSLTTSSRLYVGPEVTDDLKLISPGLNLTVDYGILWPISQALFWLLKNIHKFVGNWGVAIILVTVAIKLAFYKLSATSYRSMGHMRRIQPQIAAMKERFGDDKQRFSQSMMELYKKEKINPLGGCLPILLQIPVFIALYYVLLESVELRQAPFMFWITDLSSKDPYYVLPLLMGATMFIQQKLSPAPPDPMQAKMMMLMPVVFTFLFMSFPAGLVLYWTVNNLLSISQQWFITRGLEKEGIKRA